MWESSARTKKAYRMLRISSQDTADRVTLKLEGTLDGIWVSELLTAWQAVSPSLADRNFYVDLTSVDRVDRAGEYLLVLIYRSGGRLLGSGVVVTELIQSIERDWPVMRTGAR
jgi:ABC-type transporter Mla MlaB component